MAGCCRLRIADEKESVVHWPEQAGQEVQKIVVHKSRSSLEYTVTAVPALLLRSAKESRIDLYRFL